MKIATKHQTDKSSHVNQRALYFGSQISIKRWGNGSEGRFGTTIHELTHAAHFDFDPSSYNTLVRKGYIPPFSSAKDGAKRSLETWATTAEIYLTNHWYSIVLRVDDYKFRQDNFQDRRIIDYIHNTSTGFDMMITLIKEQNMVQVILPIG